MAPPGCRDRGGETGKWSAFRSVIGRRTRTTSKLPSRLSNGRPVHNAGPDGNRTWVAEWPLRGRAASQISHHIPAEAGRRRPTGRRAWLVESGCRQIPAPVSVQKMRLGALFCRDRAVLTPRVRYRAERGSLGGVNQEWLRRRRPAGERPLRASIAPALDWRRGAGAHRTLPSAAGSCGLTT